MELSKEQERDATVQALQAVVGGLMAALRLHPTTQPLSDAVRTAVLNGVMKANDDFEKDDDHSELRMRYAARVFAEVQKLLT